MKNYLDFEGNSKREEFWGLAYDAAVLFFAMALANLLAVNVFASAIMAITGPIMLVGMFMLAWALFATAARRARDAGISPWWSALLVIPYVNIVAMIVIGVLPTDETK